ncbi:hypothetical protein BU15DRAFT_67671 [Melanogaster broomeanus]|nr:hypothetical protein BU15DRAFT_67671 [Melanogaster broomeanus]
MAHSCTSSMHVGRAAQGADSDNAKGKTQGVDKGVERGHEKVRGPGEGATDQTADGVSLATPASSLNEHGVETSTDETTAPLSLPLEGERDSQATSGSTRAHSEGAAPPDGTIDVQGGIQSLRYTNGTRAGQQHDASAHGEGRCARAEPLHDEQQRSTPRRDCRGPGWTRPSQHASQTPEHAHQSPKQAIRAHHGRNSSRRHPPT